MAKDRVDVILAKRGLAPSREKAKALIMAGQIYVETERVTKPDKIIDGDAAIEIKGSPIPYVSFGGVKLAKAIAAFGIDATGKEAMDIGSSTGGFVDCLLKAGAASVYAIDVGTHQLHESLRKDDRITVKENVNARYLTYEDVGRKFDIITMDVSFISLKKILPVVIPFMKDRACVISLVKPQFEVGRYEVGKGGIVRDTEKIRRVISDIKEYGETLGIRPVGEVEAPREKEKKNKEYFVLWELRESRSR
ncbi:MAG TPA: TlyA family rRNA (cytidine-2'-O)-methyltransferase [Syntrophorhabdus aromaticivorans]|nr:TlyA family rRNA (cytidine-2'-O)-methyltransferase [Syntrophorhabdus aromaticivorans]